MTEAELVNLQVPLEERVAHLEADMADLRALLAEDRRSHDYLTDEYWDEAFHGLIRANVRDGYSTTESLRNDPATVRFITDPNWLKTFFRQQFTEDRSEPNFVCDDPRYKLRSFSFSARHEVFCVTFASWIPCAIKTAVYRHLASDRQGVAMRRRDVMRSLRATNGLPANGWEKEDCPAPDEHCMCDVFRGMVGPNDIDPEPIVKLFRRVRSGPRRGGRPRKVDAPVARNP